MQEIPGVAPRNHSPKVDLNQCVFGISVSIRITFHGLHYGTLFDDDVPKMAHCFSNIPSSGSSFHVPDYKRQRFFRRPS